MRCPVTRDLAGVDVAVVGVPYDSGTSYRSGARFGPRKIREASLMLWGYNNPLAVKPLDALKVIDYGDVDVIPPSIVDTYQNVESEVGAILHAGATVISLGGDHSISLPLLRAHARKFGPLSVVHFDSHPDTWDTEFGGRPYSHGTPFRRALEEKLINPAGYIQVGLRGPTSGARDWQDARDLGVRVITLDEAAALGVPAVIAAIHETVKGPTYVSLDTQRAPPTRRSRPEPARLKSADLPATNCFNLCAVCEASTWWASISWRSARRTITATSPPSWPPISPSSTSRSLRSGGHSHETHRNPHGWRRRPRPQRGDPRRGEDRLQRISL